MATPALENQPQYLAEATKKVKEQGFYMKRAMDASDLKGALQHASDMLRELRTSLLTPRNYYELYMKASELYEKAQACGDVLPRLYLLITVGAVYIKSRQAPAKDILNDLVEMAKGVQHPMRGLFLRNYLAQACKDKLPDAGSEYEGHGGDVSDANQGAKNERKRREKERQELRILVGTNLVRLSQLDGVDVGCYVETVLPRLLEQVVNCKDSIAQPYLLDCIIQVFPDEFHLATLESFLTTCTQLRDKVNVRVILEAMMRRLASGARDAHQDGGGAVAAPVKAFAAFNSCATKLVEEKKGAIELGELLKLQGALLEFAIECYPGRLDYVNHCFGTCAAVLHASRPAADGEAPAPLDDGDAEELERCLSLPLGPAIGLTGVLELGLFGTLVAYLPWKRRKDVSLSLVKCVLAAGEPLDSVDAVERLFAMIAPLLRDGGDAEKPPGARRPAAAARGRRRARADPREPQGRKRVIQRRFNVSRLAHLMVNDDTDATFKVLGCARKHFGQGGLQRIKHTLVPLVFRALDLSRKIRKVEAAGEAKLQYSSRKVFQFVHEIVTAMAGSFPALSLHLFLQCAQEADAAGLGAIAYEFVSQAFILYEDELPDSKAQLQALHLMVGTLLQASGFDAPDYDALATKTTQYAAKLFKKPDQCRMVATCSHLFWSGPPPAAPPKPEGDLLDDDGDDATAPADEPAAAPGDARRCSRLQKSLKIADACMTSSSSPINLFVEILDHYIAHFEKKCPTTTAKFITGIVALINEHVDNMENGRGDVEAHYKNTLARIKTREIIALA
ncbi:hypothetical protein JL721_2616 [Aureococcus anophagefferens]|nr:hypothetical protein JL721_2616 [Aureococcus anophagefferens]